jgi:alpha-mannosidase
MRRWWVGATLLLALTVGLTPVGTQGQATRTTLYMVATAHLDSQWNWTVQDSIRDHIPKTFHTNFDFFEKYPDYKFTWEGAIHYMWFKEYHPDEWAKVQQYVAADRWRLAGSWIDAVDTNMPSPESLFRQALYAQRFFRQEFKKEPKDVYLPDCFGFGFALPSIAAHSGLISFSTQKLTWGRPIPFPIGRWKGVDGSEIIAELNPGSYGTRMTEDISFQSTNGGRGNTPWLNDPTNIGGGQAIEFRYFGTGDTGGGPTEQSVQIVQKALTAPPEGLVVKNTSPDQLAKDLTSEQRAALPVYNDELILKTHGTGCYTSQAAMKRFNRANELLADAAEKAGVSAMVLTGQPYPTERLRDAWIRFLWHQFHDDLTGTCIPQAYQFSWNDEIASLNQFAGVLTSSTSAVSSLLDTSGTGTPIVVYNPVSMNRREPVEATLNLIPSATAVTVVDASTGATVPSQVLTSSAGGTSIAFQADVPSMGFAVYHVRPVAAAAATPSSLKVTASLLENNRIRVKIDENGDIASIYDKDAKHELLSAPIMLELRDNPSPSWPAWEVLYDTVQSPAREYVSNPTIKILERGPVRAGLEITRKASGSTFVQRIRLAEGGDRVEVENLVDWRSPNSELKASFPLTASSPKAIYDLGLGTIARTNNEPDKYEVPAQKWANIDDLSGTFGVGIINDSKYGWDKPADNTIRLTLLHTPRPNTGYTYQSSNDLGHHRFVYAIAGHAGDWRQGRMPVRATAVNQPLVAFKTTAHPGALGRAYSMATILNNGLPDTTGQVAIVAMKKAEDSDEVVLRLQERYGQAAPNVTVRLGVPVLGGREINAAEEEVGPFAIGGGGGANRGGGGGAGARGAANAPNVPPPAPTTIQVSLGSYQPRSLALSLQSAWEASTSFQAFSAAQAAAAAAAGRGGGRGGGGRGGTPPPNIAKPAPAANATITLPYNLDGVSTDALRADGDFDGKKHTIPGELFPKQLDVDGVPFAFGPPQPGAKNILVPSGQTITLPPGKFTRVYVLANAIGGDLASTIAVGGVNKTWVVREWQGPIGQWWSRLKDVAPSLHEPFAVQNGNNGL